MPQPPCDHCLRPAFTARLAQDLIERHRPVNLVGGASGQGCTRLLEDLCRCNPGMRWLVADLKAHRHRHRQARLRRDLWAQAHRDGAPLKSLGTLRDRLAHKGWPVCLLLDHFDAVLDNPEVGADYDMRFLDGLNALKYRGMGLLCVTERPHSQYILITRQGERQVSTLILERENLPVLGRPEVAVELARRLPYLGPVEAGRSGGGGEIIVSIG
jgi:hypothetical protein